MRIFSNDINQNYQYLCCSSLGLSAAKIGSSVFTVLSRAEEAEEAGGEIEIKMFFKNIFTLIPRIPAKNKVDLYIYNDSGSNCYYASTSEDK